MNNVNEMKTIYPIILFGLITLVVIACRPGNNDNRQETPSFSGVYPHLAYYNDEGECGTGAVVPWQNDLWVVTYGPHEPFGSSDKLYQITPGLQQIVRAESVGGTPANRMIHPESGQLFIGPYAIDSARNVRVIPYSEAPGRYTGMARHLTDPQHKLYIGTMEAGFYELDATTLQTTMLYEDGNVAGRNRQGVSAQYSTLLPGCHGKGLYSGQGVLVYSNNGEDSGEAKERFDIEAGSLSEWDGANWKVIRRNQFTEITGPGGISGNPHVDDPIWALGWDYKSVLLGVRHSGQWTFYRLPKASFSYDGAHGWNTEWPRIRNIGIPGSDDFLMTMHGMFWKFPPAFTPQNTAGIRPRSAYLKVVGDFTRWNERIVLGCDDTAQREFLNTRLAKGGIQSPGQSNSNLWFVEPELLNNLGSTVASGSVWLEEQVEACATSESFLFAGWVNRCAWIKNQGAVTTEYLFEVDRAGDNRWEQLKAVSIPAGSTTLVNFAPAEQAEWVRVTIDRATRTSLSFVYTNDEQRSTVPHDIFRGLQTIDQPQYLGGLLYSLGDNRRALGLLANSNGTETGYYELDATMNLVPKEDPQTAAFIRDKLAITVNGIQADSASVLVTDDRGRRWRLPKVDETYASLMADGELRLCREVATERDLFNCFGTFFELPAENADGYAKIRPVASHHLRIHDYASYRGMLIMTGIDPDVADNEHIIRSVDGKAAVWAGVIDDLWKLGKPVGCGGPWYNTAVKENYASDPYLIGFYDQRTLQLSHKATRPVTFTLEADPTGDGTWMEYLKFTVAPGETLTHGFDKAFQARWVRLRTDVQTIATAWFEYK